MRHVFSSRWIRYFVPNFGTLILMALMLFVYRASAAPNGPSVPGATPGTISYQGMLNDAAGQPINGNIGITFRLYNAPTGGTALWTEAHTGANSVSISNGLLNVLLGSLTPIPASAWSNANVYLGVQVGNDTEMSPREAINSVPTAMHTMSGPRLLGQKTCDNCANTSETNVLGWVPAKGMTTQDIIEVTVTTSGGPVLAHMTSRSLSAPAVGRWCAIVVYQGGVATRYELLDGNQTVSNDYGCSGSFLFTDLPAGTYTFQAMNWFAPTADITWSFQRQIAVYEF